MEPTETLFDVRGMSCGSCVRHIHKALDAMDGVAEVQVSLADKTVRVRYDPARASAEQLAAALTDQGYPAAARAA